MPESDLQNFGSVASGVMPKPATIASAATITPTTFLTIVTGTVQVATVTPPSNGWCLLVFMFNNAAPGALLTSGNILTAYTPIQNRPFFMVYDPVQGKWLVMSVT